MITQLRGIFVEKSPAHIVVECAGVGYFVNVSLTTYSELQKKKEGLIYTHLVVREDAHTLYGFSTQMEREMFRKLISVSGVGPNTARMILSSLTVKDVCTAIGTGNVEVLKGIKGIGAKSAQRIIVDLKDKIDLVGSGDISAGMDNTNQVEALSALVSLGFDKKVAGKVLESIVREQGDLAVENLIKQSLKKL